MNVPNAYLHKQCLYGVKLHNSGANVSFKPKYLLCDNANLIVSASQDYLNLQHVFES